MSTRLGPDMQQVTGAQIQSAQNRTKMDGFGFASLMAQSFGPSAAIFANHYASPKGAAIVSSAVNAAAGAGNMVGGMQPSALTAGGGIASPMGTMGMGSPLGTGGLSGQMSNSETRFNQMIELQMYIGERNQMYSVTSNVVAADLRMKEELARKVGQG